MQHPHSCRPFAVLALPFALVTLWLPAPVARGELPAPDPESAAGLLRRGEYESAIEAFASAVEKDPQDAAAARGLAEAYAALGRYEEGLEALGKSPRFAESARLKAMAGRIHLRTGKLDAAESALRTALELDPNDVEALNRLGEALALRGKRKDAEDLWKRLIAVYQAMSTEDAERLPAEGFVEMALALVHVNRYRDANDVMFPQAEEQEPGQPIVFLEWGRVFQDKYDFPEARDLYRKALELNPRLADARVAMAENYLIDFQVGTQRYALAEGQLAKALETNPRHAGAHTARGSLWLSDGNLPRAREDFEKALEINPASLRARGLLAACHFLDADEDAFREEEAAALAINPACAEFYHTVADSIEKRFRYLDAARIAEKALSLDGDYWRAYHTLGINLLRVGDEEKGRYYLEKSFKADPYNIWVFNTRKLLKHMDGAHRVLKTDRITFKLPKADYEVLKTYLVPLIEKAYSTIPAHYDVELVPPVFVEVFSEHKWFSARIVGLAGFPASGACFGNLVALTTPKALPQHWGAVAWHEFAHIVTLHATHHRVPRWLTEGLSVFEEGRDHPRWARLFEREIGDAYASGRLLPLAELDFGFSKPRFPGQVLMSYFQGCMIVKYIDRRWGFDKVLEVLKGYEANESTPEIFRKVFALDLDQFDEGFFAYVEEWIRGNGLVPRLHEEMVEKLQLELEREPGNVAKVVDLAWAYHSNGIDVDVPLTAGKALELDPENGDAHAILAFHHLEKGKTKTAKEHLELALEKGTRFQFRTHEALGRLALKDGEKEKAIELLRKAKEISPRAGAGYPPGKNVYYQLVELYNETGREDLAVATLEELREFAVEDARCRVLLADHYLAQGENEETARRALEALDELIYLNPFDPELHQKLARAAVVAGDAERTIREYTLLLTYPDTNPRTAHLALARAHAELGNAAEAKEHAEKVLELDPASREAQEVLEKLKS